MIFVSWINGQEEYCLSSARILTSRYQSIVDSRVKIERTSNVVDVMEYSTLNYYIVLWRRINEITSRVSLKSTEVKDCTRIIRAILISPFWTSSCCLHRSSDQCCTCENWFRRWNLILQNWTAPSSSRCTVSLCRRRLITFFETSYAVRDGADGSISIHFLSFIGMVLGNSTVSLLCGFAFAFDLAAITFTLDCDACSSGRSARTSMLL